jgi:hypothetical protein
VRQHHRERSDPGPQWVMAGLDPAIQSNIAAFRFLPWMAASRAAMTK